MRSLPMKRRANNELREKVAALTGNTEITRFFNPRIDHWHDHFEVSEGIILAKSAIAEATIKIFKMNLPERVSFRRELMPDNLFP